MADDKKLTEREGEQLRRSLAAWCDGTIGPTELAELEAMLTRSRDARAMYIAFMGIHAGIHGEVAAKQYLDSVVPSMCDADHWTASRPQNEQVKRRGRWLITAAATAATFLAVFFLWWSQGERLQVAESNAETAPASSAIFAHVVNETPDCEWSLDHHSDAPRGTIRGGDMIRVARGKVKLTYDNGTTLTLHGPALFEVVSDMRGRALLGKLTAKIAKGAEGFSVLTPRATVIDLGTELGIEVDDAGATDVVVFEGSVDLNYRLEDGGAEQQRRLVTGEAMRLDAYGTISRIVSISNQRFSDDLVTPASTTGSPAIISSVRDNIQRETAWNYYEIVRAGMGEDARAFVDRQSHEWNGIDASGMPPYLVGGDYVKTFNNDKCREDIEVIVTLDSPCRLYVLFDDRIPAPKWLRENFRDTGDKIGIDGGPWMYNGVMSKGVSADVGPGKSIDDTMSVWVREVKEPGPVRLGATETPHDDLNMYGLVAVPLASE